LMKIGRSVILLFVKLICTDLDSLSLIRHFLVQIAILFKAGNLMVELLYHQQTWQLYCIVLLVNHECKPSIRLVLVHCPVVVKYSEHFHFHDFV
jgi:hypothetical protein